MLRSMYAGVSGLKAHQTKMDVIGNNVANVNTIGFKSSRVNFKEMLYQTITNAQESQNNQGGINPIQVGSGVGIGSIDVNQTQGNLQSTGIDTDLAIEGNGFFVVNDGQENLFTRVGSLTLDNNGNLVNSLNGYKMQGWMANNEGNIDVNQALRDLKIPVGQSMPAEATDRVVFAGNLDSRLSNGINRTAAIDVYDSLGKPHTVNIDFLRQIGTNLEGTSALGLTIEQKMYDPAMDGLNIVFDHVAGSSLSASFDGINTLTVSADFITNPPTDKTIQDEINSELDSFGFSGPLEVSGTNNVPWDPIGPPIVTTDTVILGSPAFGAMTVDVQQDPLNPDANLHGLEIDFVNNPGAVADAITTLYDSDNHRVTLSADWSAATAATTTQVIEDAINDTLADNEFIGSINLDIPPIAFNANLFAGESLTLSASNHWDWDVSNITDIIPGTAQGEGRIVFDSRGRVTDGGISSISFDPIEVGAPVQNVDIVFNDPNNSVSQLATSYTIDGVNANGYNSGELNSFAINDQGLINGFYSNGIRRNLGQIGIANFSNPQGLTKQSDGLFAQSRNSGSSQIGVANIGGRGSIVGQTLEMSNVDLAEEFTEMITTQRGFQASSTIITTSDQMLQELVGLKR